MIHDDLDRDSGDRVNKRKQKLRVAFQKNRAPRARGRARTQQLLEDLDSASELPQGERLTGKGELTRHRTVIAEEASAGGGPVRVVDESVCQRGRVLRAVGSNHCIVQSHTGEQFDCAVRRVVRTLSRDARNAVVAGDEVLFQPTGPGAGVIERVEPRRTVISRGSDRREHVLVANVDQAVIVVSSAEPPLKPALIDRLLVSAEKGGVKPIICLSKSDLGDRAELQEVAGIYRHIGYDVVLASVVTGEGIADLQALLAGHESVFTGQSGVGKSTLINAVDAGLQLRTGAVSPDSGKGRHTTRVAALLPLAAGGWIVDTPGIRQMQLWDVAPFEVEAYFVEFQPFIPQCKFPDCTHTHEASCAVKAAVERGEITLMRYAGYLRIVEGDD